MSSQSRLGLAACVLLLASPLLGADDIKVTTERVEDDRSSESRNGSLEIELKLEGGTPADVKALRVKIQSARDNVGSVLNRPAPDGKPAEFVEFSPDRHPGPQLRLASPSREASTVDITGEVELFIPSRDPGTKQKFDGFLGKLDKPIASAALKATRVDITPLSTKAYKERQQANRPTKDQIIAEGKKHGATEAEIKQALALMEAFSSLNGADESSDRTVLLETRDPDGRVISIDVVGADGSELRVPSRSTSGARDVKLQKIDLAEKPPAGAALLVLIRTPRSIVTVPLSLKELALP